jgi:hypothetical protein
MSGNDSGRVVDLWIPAFAGMAVRLLLIANSFTEDEGAFARAALQLNHLIVPRNRGRRASDDPPGTRI